MAFTTYTTNRFVDAFHGKTTYTAPSNIYAALSTTTPTVGGTNFTEPSTSGTAYARVAVTASSWAAASSGSAANTSAIPFASATGAGWGDITHIGFFDSPTVGAGNLLSFDDLPAPQSIPAGVTPSIAIGQATDSVS